MDLTYINRTDRVFTLENERLLITPFLAWNNSYNFRVLVMDKPHDYKPLLNTSFPYSNGCYKIKGVELEEKLQTFLKEYRNLKALN